MRKPTPSERAQVEYYLNLDIDDLHVEIGRAVSDRDGVQYAPGTAIAKCREWIESYGPQIQQLICVEWEYCKKRSDKRLKDRVTLIVSIADLIIALGGGIPVLSIATLLFRMGLDDLCGCNSDGD